MRVTRGWGLLERWLARMRARRADLLIGPDSRHGHILDIGCGHSPFFLLQTDFDGKVGVEKSHPPYPVDSISFVVTDVERPGHLPFRESTFEVVTMLAVFEHLSPDRIVDLLNEIHRVLKIGGSFVMTTPPPWTDRLLGLMSRIHLVSRTEIDEHQQTYTRQQIAALFENSSFSNQAVSLGYFEAGLNIWGRALKVGNRAGVVS
jgi:SAM-dependent methyltransferase